MLFFIFSVSVYINQLKNIQKKQALFPVESTPGYLKKIQNKRSATIPSSTIRLEKVVNLTYTELVVKLVSASQVGGVDTVVNVTFVRNTTIGGRKHE